MTKLHLAFSYPLSAPGVIISPLQIDLGPNWPWILVVLRIIKYSGVRVINTNDISEALNSWKGAEELIKMFPPYNKYINPCIL